MYYKKCTRKGAKTSHHGPNIVGYRCATWS